MTFSLRIPLAAAIAAVLSALSGTAGAQSGAVSAVAVAADHRLLGNRLYGGAARINIPLGGGHASVRLGAERVSGNSRRTGVACAGLVMPGTCAPEPLRDDASLNTATGGLGYRALVWERFAVDVGADVRVGRVQADTRGLMSERTLSSSKTLRGFELGIDGSWFPWARLPLALEVGGSVGELTPVVSEQLIDGYTPFEGGFGLTRVRVGVEWRARSR